MMDSMEDIERQIQRLIQLKKQVSDAQNVASAGSSQSTAGNTSQSLTPEALPSGKHKSSSKLSFHPP